MRPVDPSAQTKAVFDQFNNNSQVSWRGRSPGPDGRQAYVLVNQKLQTQKLADGQNETTRPAQPGLMFDAQTYKLLESLITVPQNGRTS